jgi:hypothetical protein
MTRRRVIKNAPNRWSSRVNWCLYALAAPQDAGAAAAAASAAAMHERRMVSATARLEGHEHMVILNAGDWRVLHKLSMIHSVAVVIISLKVNDTVRTYIHVHAYSRRYAASCHHNSNHGAAHDVSVHHCPPSYRWMIIFKTETRHQEKQRGRKDTQIVVGGP